MRRQGFVVVFFLIAVLVFASQHSFSESARQTPKERLITIGTGAAAGVYYPVGGAICRLLNRSRDQHGIRCLFKRSEGSIANLRAIRAGFIDLGEVQSDWQFHAYHGNSEFRQDGPDGSLRALFSLHDEMFTVLTRSDTGIKSFADLKGKRVNIGNLGSGQRATWEMFMKTLHWTQQEFASVLTLPPNQQAAALCNKLADVIVYTAGHPNRSILEATTACDAVLVDMSGGAIDSLVRSYPYYTYAAIPGDMYRGNPDPVNTFAVKATLVTSERLADEVAYQITKAVFDQFDDFRRLHPALKHLNKKRMVTEGNGAPLHPGAVRYYHAAGLLGE